MVDQPRKVDKGWPLSCARRLLAISWSNRGDGAMRPTHMAEERSAKAAKEGRPRLASDFQASDWLTSEEEFPVAPNPGTLTGVQQGPAAPQFSH